MSRYRQVQTQSTVIAAAAQIKSSSGPIPDPYTLERYKEVHPESVQWIFDSAEDERKHRHANERDHVEMEKDRLKYAIKYRCLGMWLGFGAVIASLGVVTYGFHLGLQWGAGVLGGATIVGLAYAFIGGKKSQSKP